MNIVISHRASVQSIRQIEVVQKTLDRIRRTHYVRLIGCSLYEVSGGYCVEDWFDDMLSVSTTAIILLISKCGLRVVRVIL